MDTIIQTDNGKAAREISSASVPAYLTALAKRPDVGFRDLQTLACAAGFVEYLAKQGNDMSNAEPITHNTLPAHLRDLSEKCHGGIRLAFIHAATIIENVPALEGEF